MLRRNICTLYYRHRLNFAKMLYFYLILIFKASRLIDLLFCTLTEKHRNNICLLFSPSVCLLISTLLLNCTRTYQVELYRAKNFNLYNTAIKNLTARIVNFSSFLYVRTKFKDCKSFRNNMYCYKPQCFYNETLNLRKQLLLV